MLSINLTIKKRSFSLKFKDRHVTLVLLPSKGLQFRRSMMSGVCFFWRNHEYTE